MQRWPWCSTDGRVEQGQIRKLTNGGMASVLGSSLCLYDTFRLCNNTTLQTGEAVDDEGGCRKRKGVETSKVGRQQNPGCSANINPSKDWLVQLV